MSVTEPTRPLAARELTITRVFDAPSALVFKAWTEAAQLAQWWGPKGFANPVCEFEARLDGKIRIHMHAPDGAVYPMKGEVREITPPERLAFTNIAVDKAGRHLLEGFTTVTFTEETGRTKMILHTRASVVANEAIAYLQGMEMGWTMSIDKLQALLTAAAG